MRSGKQASLRTLFAGPRADDAALASKINEILSPTFKAGEPGAALLIVKDGRVMIRKGYGTADLELGVPVEPDMSFRLGSMTKRFTAVEEAKLITYKNP